MPSVPDDEPKVPQPGVRHSGLNIECIRCVDGIAHIVAQCAGYGWIGEGVTALVRKKRSHDGRARIHAERGNESLNR